MLRASFAGDALASLAGDTFASFAGETFAMRIAVTILVDVAAGLLVDLIVVEAADFFVVGLVRDFFDMAMGISFLSDVEVGVYTARAQLVATARN
jgi:hypothetical protein